MSELSRESAECVSALVDGQLEGDGFGQCMHELQRNPQVQANWDAYHLIGRVMRSGSSEAQAVDAAFVARLSQRINQEAIQIEPVPATPIVPNEVGLPPAAANRDNWRRVAGLASVMLVAVLAWQGFGTARAIRQVRHGPRSGPRTAHLHRVRPWRGGQGHDRERTGGTRSPAVAQPVVDHARPTPR